MTVIHPPSGVGIAGFIPRVEYTPESVALLNFLKPPYALLNLTDARQCVNKGVQAADIAPEPTQLITTSTVADGALYNISISDEVKIVTKFSPSYHIPADESIYTTHSVSERKAQIEQLIDGTRGVAESMQEPDSPVLLPLIKGVTQEELSSCWAQLADLDVQTVVFYGSQYFTAGGDGRNEYRGALTRLQNAIPSDKSLLLIGGAGETLWDAYPSQTVGVASWFAWYSRLKAYYPEDVEMQTAMETPDAILTDEAIEETYLPFTTALTDALDVDAPVSYRFPWYPSP